MEHHGPINGTTDPTLTRSNRAGPAPEELRLSIQRRLKTVSAKRKPWR
ncbi:hypothetical protein Gohar_024849 [Gossypium harknessii]|uniref:Uncharacterized protein n=1 Tax=Gossypium harknessii TaxID=34285 RepID=A0A7J9HH64_9ROSI|nr:hypothetical protein [Gossypium harknessii]